MGRRSQGLGPSISGRGLRWWGTTRTSTPHESTYKNRRGGLLGPVKRTTDTGQRDWTSAWRVWLTGSRSRWDKTETRPRRGDEMGATTHVSAPRDRRLSIPCPSAFLLAQSDYPLLLRPISHNTLPPRDIPIPQQRRHIHIERRVRSRVGQ